MFPVSRAASDILVLTSIVLQMRPLALCGSVCGLPSILGGQLIHIYVRPPPAMVAKMTNFDL